MSEPATAPKKRVHVREIANDMARIAREKPLDKNAADELLCNLVEVLAYYLNDCNYHTSNVYYTLEIYRRIQKRGRDE